MWPSLAFIAHVFTQYNKILCIYSLKELGFLKLLFIKLNQINKIQVKVYLKKRFIFYFHLFFSFSVQ